MADYSATPGTDTELPTMADAMRASYAAKYASLPPGPTPVDPNQPGVIAGGLGAGWREGVGALGSTVAAVGSALNLPTLQGWGERQADSWNAAAQKAGRPDLEGNPLAAPTWGGIAERAGYQVAKMVPTIGGILGATALTGGLGLPGSLAARALGAGATVMAPQNLAGMYESERHSPGGVTPEKSREAIAMDVPLSLATAYAPAGFLSKTFGGNLFGRMAGGALTGAAANAVGSGLSTAADLSFRPDIAPSDKMSAMVDSVVSGATVGGLVGGAFGAFHPHTDPSMMSNEEMRQATNAKLGLPAEPAATPDTTAAPEQAPEPIASETAAPPVAGEPRGIDAVLNAVPAAEAAPKADPYAGLSKEELADVQQSTKMKALDLAALAKRNPGLKPKAEAAQADLAEVDQSVEAREKPPEPAKEPVEEPSPESKTAPEPPAAPTLQDRIKGAYETLTDNGKAVDTAAIRAALPDVDKGVLTKALKAMNDDEETDAKLETKPGSEVTDADKAAAVKYKNGDTFHQLWIPEEERANAVREPSPESADVQQVPKDGGAVGEGHPEGDVASQEAAPGQDSTAPETPPADHGLGDNLTGWTPQDQVDLQTRIAQSQARVHESAVSAISAVPKEGGLTPHQLEAQQLDALLRNSDLTPAKRDRVEQAAADVAVGNPDTAHAEVDQFNEPKAKLSFTPKSPPMPGDAVQKVWERATRNLSPESLASIDFVKTAADMPPEAIQAAVKAGLDPSKLAGMHYQGRNYIIGDKLRSPADLQIAIFHEVLGHQAARTLGNHPDTMFDIFARAGGTEGILKIADKYGVGDELRRYLPDGGIASPKEAVRFADEMLAQVQGQNQGKFSLALREWAGNIKQAALTVMRKLGLNDLADRWSSFSALDTAAMLGKMRDVMAPGGAPSPMEREAAFMRTPEGADFAALKFSDAADRAKLMLNEHVLGGGPKQASDKAKQLFLFFNTKKFIAESYAKIMPHTQDIVTLQDTRNRQAGAIQQMRDVAQKQEAALRAADPRAAELVQRLQKLTEFNIDPAKTWGEHTWLHGEPNAVELKAAVDKANKDYRTLRQNKNGAGALYDTLVATENSANLMKIAGSQHELVTKDYKGIDADVFKVHPMDIWQNLNDLHDSPSGTRDHFRAVVDQQRADIKAYLDQKSGQAAGGQKSTEINGSIASLRSLDNRVADSLKQMNQAPNFHLGHAGDQFVSAHLLKSADGRIDPRAFAAAEKLLQKNGFSDLSLNNTSSEAHFFARVENVDRADSLRKVFEQLRDQKLLDPNEEIKAGPVTDMNMMKGMAPVYLERLLAIAKEHGEAMMPADATPEMKKAAVQAVEHIQSLWMDMLPDMSVHKIFQQREGKQGYDTDMMRNYAARGLASTNGIVHQSTASRISDAMAAMHQDAKNLRTTHDVATATQGARIASEMALREAQHQWKQTYGFLDTAVALNHGYFLGASPAYVFMQMAQLGITAWPELSRTYGHVAAAKAMAKMTPMAFKVMTAMAKSGRVADAVFSSKDLRAGGVPEKIIAKVMDGVNRSKLESFAQAGRAARGGVVESPLAKTLRYANTTAVYSEQFSRVVTLLAAHELHEGNPGKTAMSANEYAAKSVSNGMFDWASHTNPRAFGKMGFAGPLSPVMTAFHNYTIRLAETLYTNVYDAIKGETAEDRAGARRFLAGHLAAVIATSGAMGLPAAGAFAGAATRLTGLFNDGESYDVDGGIRNFFSDVFGKELGGVLTRGVPRALGADMGRFGDADLAPFTSFLEDRRKMEDAIPDYMMHIAGSPVSMMANAAKGMRDMALGKGLQGLQEFMPTAMKNLVGAYRMTQGPNGTYQYVDNTGNVLPIAPDAADVLARATGFDPGAHATYMEADRAQKGAKEERAFRSANIEHQYVAAAEHHDQAGMVAAMEKAKEFTKEHPIQADLPRLGAALEKHLKDLAIARTTGAPLGTPANDRALQQQTRYGNFLRQ